MGFHIGSIFCGSIAVAGDFLYLSKDSIERQIQANIQSEFAQNKRYEGCPESS